MLSIVSQLSGVYKELADALLWSDLLQVDLSEAEARGQLERLMLRQCNPQPQSWNIVLQDWSIDVTGVIADGFPREIIPGRQPEDFYVRNPNILFLLGESDVHLRMHFGRKWRWMKEARLDDSGRLRRETLRDVCYRTPTRTFDERDPLSPEFRCFGCGDMIRQAERACSRCGWTWDENAA